MRKLPLLVAASIVTALPAAVVAQDTMDDASMTAAPVEDDDDFPWGLLGLLGLAGLLGLKRNDRDRVHTDRRV